MLNDLFPDDIEAALAARQALEGRELDALGHFLQDYLDEFKRHAAYHGHLEPDEAADLLIRLTRHARP